MDVFVFVIFLTDWEPLRGSDQEPCTRKSNLLAQLPGKFTAIFILG